MISSMGFAPGMSSNTQCVISAQGIHNYSILSNQVVPETKEDNLYNSVFSKLAYDKSIEEVSNLIRIYNNPVNNDHDALFSILTQEKYRELATALYNLKIKKRNVNYLEKGYEKIRINIILSFESLLYSMYQTKLAAANKRTYEGFKKDSEILHNTEKLKEFIENLSMTSHILPEVVVSAPLMKIKPEYALYMKKYGVPTNGVWKPDLLAEMVEELKVQKKHHQVYRKTTATSPEKEEEKISREDDKEDRVNILRRGDESKHMSRSSNTEEDIKENRNIVMQMQISSSLPERKTREEMKRNPIHQTPIQRVSIQRKVEEEPSEELFKEETEKEEEDDEDDSNTNTIPIEVGAGSEGISKIESDYIPWEQWEMIPLAYWNALLK